MLGLGKDGKQRDEDNNISIEHIRRSRAEKFYADPRHLLYRQYIKILSKFRPRIFIMENVKGILSAKKDYASKTENRIYEDITSGLRDPNLISFLIMRKMYTSDNNLKYRLYALSKNKKPGLLIIKK